MQKLLTFAKKLVLNIDFFRYEIEEFGFSNRDDYYQLSAYFINDIKVSSAHLTIDPLTLLTRIGGIIGVGQVLTWVIIFCYERFATLIPKMLDVMLKTSFNKKS